VVGVSLGNARGDCADADLGDQLDADASLRVDVFQVMDQLRQVFDRVNIVVGRRRNQAYTRRRMAHPGNHSVHFMSR
jgi:hypothetical protein